MMIHSESFSHSCIRAEHVAEWLRRLTRNPKVRTAVCSNPMLDSLVAVRNTSPGQPEPCEGNLVAVAGSCGELMVKHPWPLLEISLPDFRGLATLDINTYLPVPVFDDFARHRLLLVFIQRLFLCSLTSTKWSFFFRMVFSCLHQFYLIYHQLRHFHL